MESWSADTGALQGGQRLAFKLKRLRRRLRVWAREARTARNDRKHSASKLIKRLDTEEETRALSTTERTARQGEKAIVAMELKMEEIEWRQKSKALWLKAGDNNTRFFHTIASQRKRSNCINSMHIEGVLHRGQQDLASQLVEHFSRAFRWPRRWFPKWKDETLPQLSRDQLNELARPFHEEEI
ncbi:hypothetical protein QJS10_CPA07g00724 [Acorus calamus]|uniref:Reverse transcriptase n=1 Tax=Acorus calamus TaxID=4465 RepID=A0AAV9EEC1_ACOCL|nr:hypothetical protein QJS10_CPA07g00724 [Acorus calamus]